MSKLNKNIIYFIVAIIFLGYIIPALYSFFVSHPFTYVTAWDEETYLSYQGALAVRNLPGYSISYLISWLQNLGIAGAVQNLLFLLIIPPATTYLVYKTFRQLNKPTHVALAYAVIILFGSILFNYCNPWIVQLFGLPRTLGFVVPGAADFPLILRVPNPQFSYFFIALAVYWSVKKRNIIYLFLPLPILYYFVVVPYCYLLSVIVLAKTCGSKITQLRIIVYNVLAYVLLAILLYGLFLWISPAQVKLSSSLYVVGRSIHLPLVGLLGVVLYILLRPQNTLAYVLQTLILCAFAVSNLQVVTGYSLILSALQDYGVGIVAGMMLVTSLEIIYSKKLSDMGAWGAVLPEIYKQGILFSIAGLFLLSQGFVFKTLNFAIYVGEQLSAAEMDRIKQDPLHAIILSTNLAGKTAYAVPKLLAPVFAYQYRFAGINKQCQYNKLLTMNAVKFLKENADPKDPSVIEILKDAQIYFTEEEKFASMPYKNAAYCDEKIYTANNFYIIKPDASQVFLKFPHWGKMLNALIQTIKHSG